MSLEKLKEAREAREKQQKVAFGEATALKDEKIRRLVQKSPTGLDAATERKVKEIEGKK